MTRMVAAVEDIDVVVFIDADRVDLLGCGSAVI
jgi:hypothetical protein